MSYDDVPEIRDLYKSVRFKKIRLNHTGELFPNWGGGSVLLTPIADSFQ